MLTRPPHHTGPTYTILSFEIDFLIGSMSLRSAPTHRREYPDPVVVRKRQGQLRFNAVYKYQLGLFLRNLEAGQYVSHRPTFLDFESISRLRLELREGGKQFYLDGVAHVPRYFRVFASRFFPSML